MPWSSAAANVALPLELAGLPRKEARARAVRSLEKVGLGSAAALKPRQMSGGMAMRASLARAMATEPKLLLLDEPFAALDEVTRRRLADDVLTLWAEHRPAVVFVTHNVEEAVYMARRVIVMSAGPGRLAAEVETPGPLPRPPGYRFDPAYRAATVSLSEILERTLADTTTAPDDAARGAPA
jgi:NitT/TauT family transport system ATP-binding protein